MMRIAYILSAYTDAPHLRRLVDALDDGWADFYVHIDRKVDDTPFRKQLAGRAIFVPRHWISWGGWEQVEYQKELLKAVMQSGVEYGRVVCLSGQDYPLWSRQAIRSCFERQSDSEFIIGMNLTRSGESRFLRRVTHYHPFRDLPWRNNWLKNKLVVAGRWLMRLLPLRKPACVTLQGGSEVDVYFGSDYWALTETCARYVYDALCREKKVVRYFRHSFVPSEMCIQTLVFNSPFAGKAIRYDGAYRGLHALTPLHYIEYGKCIKLLTADDWPRLRKSGKMFARKVVSGHSDALVSLINAERTERVNDE